MHYNRSCSFLFSSRTVKLLCLIIVVSFVKSFVLLLECNGCIYNKTDKWTSELSFYTSLARPKSILEISPKWGQSFFLYLELKFRDRWWPRNNFQYLQRKTNRTTNICYFFRSSLLNDLFMTWRNNSHLREKSFRCRRKSNFLKSC